MWSSVFTFIFSGILSLAADCERLDFHYIEKLKPAKKIIEVCKLDEKLVSRDCQERSCGLLTWKGKGKLHHPSYGNPAARQCFEMGGLAVAGQLKRGEKVIHPNKSLCFTRSMRSFVEVQLLFPPPENPFLQ